MKYSLVNCINGNFSVVSEHGENLQGAKVAFFNRCAVLTSASDVITGMIAIVDENLDPVDGKKEFISHPVAEGE